MDDLLQVAHSRRLPRLALLVPLLAATAAYAQGPPAQAVAVSPLIERDLPASLRLVGTVRADKSAVVASEVEGIVAEFPTREGQFLRAGDLICRLDATIAELNLEEARGRLGRLEAELAALENGTRPEVLKQLEAAQGAAEAQFELWKFERKRIADLYSHNQSSDKEKHDTEMEYLTAERRLAQAQATYEEAKNGPRQEDIAAARHDVAAQRATVQRIERDLSKTQIRAPFDGFIISRNTEVGEWIQIGGAVAEMTSIEVVKVRTDVPESAIAFATAGAPATVEIEALGESREAKVTRVIPQAIESARTFPIEIELENADHRLLPGMFVWAHVPSGPLSKRLMAPKDAVVPRGTQKHIFVVHPGQGGAMMAMPISVDTGLEIEGQIEVRADGIQPGDLVAVRGNERLMPFMPSPVMPTPFNGAPNGGPTSQPAGEAGHAPSATSSGAGESDTQSRNEAPEGA